MTLARHPAENVDGLSRVFGVGWVSHEEEGKGSETMKGRDPSTQTFMQVQHLGAGQGVCGLGE